LPDRSQSTPTKKYLRKPGQFSTIVVPSLCSMPIKDEPVRCPTKLRAYLAASLTLFLAGGLVGALATPYAPDMAQHFHQNVADFVKLFRALPKPALAAAIFLNNTIKALLVIVGGLALGLLPVIFLLANGAALGFVLSASIRSRGILDPVLAILPHGIFELPAILLAAGMGLLLGACSIKKLFRLGDASIARELALALKLFLRIVVPLLAVAALVEAFLTPILITS
jgi:stage II sporulation protein M